MEVNPIIKACNICKKEATEICIECTNYFCESCFELTHNDTEYNNHQKEKIDYYVPYDERCPQHPLNLMNSFCVNEKGKLKNI